MAEIIASKTPGHYPTGQSLTLTFPTGTRKVIITRDDRPPVLTEILAYDNGPITPIPPDPNNPGASVKRPFLAVTQDGKGNVVYDGGFPKFYNMQMCTSFEDPDHMTFPAQRPNTRAQLTPSSQYLLNELSFIASVKKVGLGNRKILFVNNTTRLMNYNLKGSHYNPDPTQAATGNNILVAFGFRDTFDAVCTVGNWIPTYYDMTDAGGDINLTTAYLDQFAAVVILASRECPNMNETGFSDQFALNVAQYRRFGNGVAIITDHCNDNYTSLSDALSRGAWFGAGANKITQYYMAFFSGNVDRSPISVGAIRAQSGGDHPLFAGMSDSDMIYAGGSESLTMPEDTTGIEVPTTPYTVSMNTAGTYRFNVLVQLNDGTIITRNLKYVVINPSDINILDAFGRGPGASGFTTYKQVIDYSIGQSTITDALYGQILLDSTPIGWFATSKATGNWVTSYSPLAGASVPLIVKNGQRLRFVTSDPFEYEVNALINIPDETPYYTSSASIATFITQMLSHPFYTGLTRAQMVSDITSFASKCYPLARSLGNFITGQWWKIIGKARPALAITQNLDPIRVKIYDTVAAWNTAKPTIGSVGDAVIISSTNAVYYWNDATLTWLSNPSNAATLFGTDRKAVNLVDNTNWIVQASSTVPA